jgi:hypothetical protein
MIFQYSRKTGAATMMLAFVMLADRCGQKAGRIDRAGAAGGFDR